MTLESEAAEFDEHAREKARNRHAAREAARLAAAMATIGLGMVIAVESALHAPKHARPSRSDLATLADAMYAASKQLPVESGRVAHAHMCRVAMALGDLGRGVQPRTNRLEAEKWLYRSRTALQGMI